MKSDYDKKNTRIHIVEFYCWSCLFKPFPKTFRQPTIPSLITNLLNLTKQGEITGHSLFVDDGKIISVRV